MSYKNARREKENMVIAAILQNGAVLLVCQGNFVHSLLQPVFSVITSNICAAYAPKGKKRRDRGAVINLILLKKKSWLILKNIILKTIGLIVYRNGK